MKVGIKLKDGSIWTAISYDVIEEAQNKCGFEIVLSDITELSCVKWKDGYENTHPLKACFSECFWEDFKIDDVRIDKISLDVFDLID